MKRTFNLRFFLILLVVVVATVAGGYFLHQYQMKQQVNIYLKKAEQALETKELPKAREYFERYIMLNPKDVQTFNRYAMLVDDSAKSRPEQVRAYLSLEKALRKYSGDKTLGDPPAELLKRAASRALSLQRYSNAESHLSKLVQGSTTDVALVEMMARAKVGKGEIDKAIESYTEVITKAPESLSSYKALAELNLLQKNVTAAREILNQMVQKNPRSGEAHLIRYKFKLEQGEFKGQEAEDALKMARELSSSNQVNADVLFSSAQLALSKQKLNEANDFLTQGLKQFPQDVRFYISKAEFELRNKSPNRADALQLLQEAIPLVGENPDDQWRVAKLLLDAGEKPQATKLYEALKTKFGSTPVIEYLRARLLYLDGKIGEAVAIQERIKDGLATTPAIAFESDALLMLCYEALGNPDRRLSAVERMLKIDSNPVLQLKRADILASMGRQNEAMELYQQFASRVPGSRLAMIRAMLVNEMRKNDEQRNWNQITSSLEQCTADEKKSRDYRLLQIQLLQLTKKTSELEEIINLACREQPKEMVFWLAKLAFNSQKPGLTPEARQRALQEGIQEAEKAAGDHVELRITKALLILAQNNKDPLDSLAKLEEGTDKLSPADRANLNQRLADIYQSIGFSKDAKRLLTKNLTSNAGDLNALDRLVTLAIEEKNQDETNRLVKLMRDAEGEEGYQWRLATVRGLLFKLKQGERSQLLETRKLIDEISKLRPGWHHSITLQARLLEANGQIDQALEQYKRAIEMGERDAEVVKKTVQLLAMRRRPQEAKQILDSTQMAPLLGNLGAELTLLLTKDAEQRLATARQAVRADSNDFREFLWLGNVQWSNKDKSGAEASFRKAVQLGKEYPETWANWICYLVEMDRKNEAANELKLAETALKDKITYVQVAYYQALKQLDKAQEYYAKLVNDNPTDMGLFQGLVGFHMKQGNFSQAESLIKKQLNQPLLDASTTSWLRRNYAITLAMKGDYPSYQEALKVVDQNLKENSSSPEDLRTRALILSTRTGSRENIIRDLEASFNRLKPSPTESRLLAQLYEEEDNWPKANSLLEQMIRDNEGASPANLAFYVQAMLRHDQLDKASEALTKLEEKAKQEKVEETFIIEPKARWLMKKGEKQKTIELLEDFANRNYATTKDPGILLGTATLLEQLGIKESAEKVFRRYVSETEAKSPGNVVALAGFLARQGLTTDALNTCEQYASKLSPSALALALVSVVNTSKPLKSELERVETKVKALQEASKDDIGVTFALANLMGAMKRPAAAEALYREILLKEKNNPVVLNNLAWLICERPDAIQEAMQLINRAIELAGPEAALLDTRGMILLKTGKLTDAIKDLSLSTEKTPEPTHFLHLCYAYHLSKNRDEAAKIWQRAKVLNEDELSAEDKLQYTTLKLAYSK